MSKKTLFTVISMSILMLLTSITTLSFINYQKQEATINNLSIDTIQELDNQQPLYYEYANRWELHQVITSTFDSINEIQLAPQGNTQVSSHDEMIEELQYNLTFNGGVTAMRDTLKHILEDERYITIHQLNINVLEHQMDINYSLFNKKDSYV